MKRQKSFIKRIIPRLFLFGLVLFIGGIQGTHPLWLKSSNSSSSVLQESLGLNSTTDKALDSGISQRNDCDRVLLYATDYLNPVGLVAQLNTFLRAVLIAIVEDRRLVFLHSNEDSMFGCPGSNSGEESYPGGLSHVLDVSLLSHQCPPPSCQRLAKWHRLAYRVIQKKNLDAHMICRDRNRLEASVESSTDVLLLGGMKLREYFREHIEPQLDKAKNLEEWARRLGVTSSKEIELLRIYASKNATHDLYRNQIMSLVKPFVRFQPWIMNEVKAMVTNYKGEVPFGEMVGIHVRRGDKLKIESRYWVEDYWKKKGYSKENMPTNFVPLSAYLEQISPSFESIRHVYIATDDTMTIRKEIDELPNADQWKFHFNPSTSGGHLNTLEDCRDKYQHTIAAIFDLMVLQDCGLFVGEYNSNWGRWIRYRRDGKVRVVFGPRDISWPR